MQRGLDVSRAGGVHTGETRTVRPDPRKRFPTAGVNGLVPLRDMRTCEGHENVSEMLGILRECSTVAGARPRRIRGLPFNLCCRLATPVVVFSFALSLGGRVQGGAGLSEVSSSPTDTVHDKPLARALKEIQGGLTVTGACRVGPHMEEALIDERWVSHPSRNTPGSIGLPHGGDGVDSEGRDYGETPGARPRLTRSLGTLGHRFAHLTRSPLKK
jgi:hypothetical protein